MEQCEIVHSVEGSEGRGGEDEEQGGEKDMGGGAQKSK